MPNKLWQYIYAEIPVISTNLTSLTNFTKNYKIGEVFRENNVNDFIKSASTILENYDFYRPNLKKTKKIFNWNNEANKIKNIIDGM